MFLGFIDEGVEATLPFQIRDADQAPIEPDAAPGYRVYGADGVLTAGTGNAASFETGTITGATNAAPIVVTSAAHGVSTGQAVTVAGVGGNTAANGAFVATAIDANTFSLQGTTGNSAYTSGGTWKTTGLYGVHLSGSILSGFEAGKTYTAIVDWAESTNPRVAMYTFTVR